MGYPGSACQGSDCVVCTSSLDGYSTTVPCTAASDSTGKILTVTATTASTTTDSNDFTAQNRPGRADQPPCESQCHCSHIHCFHWCRHHGDCSWDRLHDHLCCCSCWHRCLPSWSHRHWNLLDCYYDCQLHWIHLCRRHSCNQLCQCRRLRLCQDRFGCHHHFDLRHVCGIFGANILLHDRGLHNEHSIGCSAHRHLCCGRPQGLPHIALSDRCYSSSHCRRDDPLYYQCCHHCHQHCCRHWFQRDRAHRLWHDCSVLDPLVGCSRRALDDGHVLGSAGDGDAVSWPLSPSCRNHPLISGV